MQITKKKQYMKMTNTIREGAYLSKLPDALFQEEQEYFPLGDIDLWIPCMFQAALSKSAD
jgi:hypothetical protein